MVRNQPVPLTDDEIAVGYRNVEQAVLATISDAERLTFSDREVKEMGTSFSEFYMGRRNHACMTSGMSYNPADWRHRQKRIKLHRV